jgi:putative ABC transport system ATP-binding protein
LATNPEIVLADEPTANLDSKTSLMIIDLMKKVNQDEKTTFLFSTHDPMITETVDHVIHILDGELEKIAAGVQ